MSNRTNSDELFAEKWLQSRNYKKIKQICVANQPPDFTVGDNIAIEVRRLNKQIKLNGETQGEENQRIPFHQSIKRALDAVMLPEKNRAWMVSWEYDFTKKWPRSKVIQHEILKIIPPLIQQYETSRAFNALQTSYFDKEKHRHELDYLTYPHICLPCGICLGIKEYNAIDDSGFYLGEQPEDEGVAPAAELIQSLQPYINEKATTVKRSGRLNDYGEWWLVFVDHICRVPINILSDAEIDAVQNSITCRHFWARILLIGRMEPSWWIEF